MVRKIVQSGQPILRQKAKKVIAVDKKVKEVIKDLFDTLATQKEPEGVGLAAPQIGKSLQIFLAKYKDFERVVINPEIISKSAKKKISKDKERGNKEILEGCLSLPYYYGPLERAQKVVLKYLNQDNKEVT